jgi:sulfide:quinone oxidoreductase
MDPKQLTPLLSVSGQIEPDDLPILAARGFHGIINNRPDGESGDQPTSAGLEIAARRLGLAYRHIPVEPGQLAEEKVDAFRAALEEMRGPLLAFCRTGTRSAGLWALSQAPRLDAAAILRTAAQAGYDLTGLAPRLAAADVAGAGGCGAGGGPAHDPASPDVTGRAAR